MGPGGPRRRSQPLDDTPAGEGASGNGRIRTCPGLLSINHSAASTLQPSILDSEDSNYFNCATRTKNMFMVLLFRLKRADSDLDLRG